VLLVEPDTEVLELPTAASSIELVLAVRSLEAHPARNMKLAIRIASFCIVLLYVQRGPIF
jgi:hypothetical protein